jgi:hypothetical protein
LLDEKNLVEIASPDYAGERLMTCYNPMKERAFLTGMNFEPLESLTSQHALSWREAIGFELAPGLAVNPYLPSYDSR